jgi:hypothetical protein
LCPTVLLTVYGERLGACSPVYWGVWGMGPKQNECGKITQIFCEGWGYCIFQMRSGKCGVGHVCERSGVNHKQGREDKDHVSRSLRGRGAGADMGWPEKMGCEPILMLRMRDSLA